MKTKIIISALLTSLFVSPIFAQDRTTVNATSSEISDNLDLRAIASIFGEAKNLEDFERQINDPKIQISNLDLNNDNQVDYLRVIESVEDNTHLIIIQSVLGSDTFQDVATIEVERDSHNQVQIQVVGDVYMYGENYIYEPVYAHAPIIYTSFWAPVYHPYVSVWYWNYYPTYYYAWTPFPIFRYRHNINVHINFNNHYNYATVRHCQRAEAMYYGRRSNYCERQYPDRAFAYRNTSAKNRYELDKARPVRAKNDVAYNSTRNNGERNNSSIRNSTIKKTDANVRGNNTVRNNTTRNNGNGKNNNGSSEIRTPRSNNNSNSVREINPQNSNTERQRDNSVRETPSRNENTKQRSEIRNSRPRENNSSRNGRANDQGNRR